MTIRLGATPSGLTSAHLHHPRISFLRPGCPSCCPTNSVIALKAINKYLIMLKFLLPFVLSAAGTVFVQLQLFAAVPIFSLAGMTLLSWHGNRTLRTQDTSGPRHFGTCGTSAEVALVPKCPDSSATRQFGTKTFRN